MAGWIFVTFQVLWIIALFCFSNKENSKKVLLDSQRALDYSNSITALFKEIDEINLLNHKLQAENSDLKKLERGVKSFKLQKELTDCRLRLHNLEYENVALKQALNRVPTVTPGKVIKKKGKKNEG